MFNAFEEMPNFYFGWDGEVYRAFHNLVPKIPNALSISDIERVMESGKAEADILTELTLVLEHMNAIVLKKFNEYYSPDQTHGEDEHLLLYGEI